MSDFNAVANATTGVIEYVPMTPEEIADRELRQAAARTMQAVEDTAEQAKLDAVAAVADMPDEVEIGSAKDFAQLQDMTLRLHRVVAALVKHTGMAG